VFVFVAQIKIPTHNTAAKKTQTTSTKVIEQYSATGC
jgi:hypothetical protein